MKRLFIILSVALLAIGCNKEGEENTEKNFISYDTEKTTLVVNNCGYISLEKLLYRAAYTFSSDFTLNGASAHIDIRISEVCKGKKVDISKFGSTDAFYFEIQSFDNAGGHPYDIRHFCVEYRSEAEVHDPAYPCFKSGTMKLKDDGETLTLDVNGTLDDGRSFKMNITTDRLKFD